MSNTNLKWEDQEPHMTSSVTEDLADIDDADSSTEVEGYDILSSQQVGFIKFVDYERGFGFIKKGNDPRSQDGDQVFYRSLHFEGNEDLEFAGMRVLFKLARSKHPKFKDKSCAVDVVPKPLPNPEPKRQEKQIVPHPNASNTNTKNFSKLDIFENSNFKLVAYLHNVNRSKSQEELTNLILQQVIIEKQNINELKKGLQPEMEKELQHLRFENKKLTDQIQALNANTSSANLEGIEIIDVANLFNMKHPPQCLSHADIVRHVGMYKAFQDKMLDLETMQGTKPSSFLKKTLQKVYQGKDPFFFELIENFYKDE